MNNQIKREDIPTGLNYDILTMEFEYEMGRFDPSIANSLIQKKLHGNTWKNPSIEWHDRMD